MDKRLIGTYSSMSEALQNVDRLRNQGYSRDDITVVANKEVRDRFSTYMETDVETQGVEDVDNVQDDDKSLWESIKEAFTMDDSYENNTTDNPDYDSNRDPLFSHREAIIREGHVAVLVEGEPELENNRDATPITPKHVHEPELNEEVHRTNIDEGVIPANNDGFKDNDRKFLDPDQHGLKDKTFSSYLKDDKQNRVPQPERTKKVRRTDVDETVTPNDNDGFKDNDRKFLDPDERGLKDKTLTSYLQDDKQNRVPQPEREKKVRKTEVDETATPNDNDGFKDNDRKFLDPDERGLKDKTLTSYLQDDKQNRVPQPEREKKVRKTEVDEPATANDNDGFKDNDRKFLDPDERGLKDKTFTSYLKDDKQSGNC